MARARGGLSPVAGSHGSRPTHPIATTGVEGLHSLLPVLINGLESGIDALCEVKRTIHYKGGNR